MNSIKHVSLFILSVIIGISIQSCSDDYPCVHGHGELVTVYRTLGDFSEINFCTEGTVYISQGSTPSFKIEAEQNVIDDMITEIHGGELQIYNDHCLKDHKPINVYIVTPDLTAINMSGSGEMYTTSKITSTEFNVMMSGSGSIYVMDSVVAPEMTCDLSGSGSIDMIAYCTSMDAINSGSGDIKITGSADLHDYDQSGSGVLRSFGFITNTADISLSGSGDAEVYVNNELEVDISGSGNVYYKGTPIVTTHISGSGNVIHVD